LSVGRSTFLIGIPDIVSVPLFAPLAPKYRVCPHIWAPQPAWTAPPVLSRSTGPRVRSHKFRVCPHIRPTMRPFRSPRWKLRVERFTLNVPDRRTGHRVCPHIWAPQPVWTARPALGQVHSLKSPVVQTSCLSPYPPTLRPFGHPVESW